MFAHESLLAIAFRFVNFGILIWLCTYAFKGYILPVLRDQIRQEEQEHIDIAARHKEMRDQARAVVRFAQEQEALCAVLKERVVQWQRAEDALLQKRHQEKERCVRYLQDQVAVQEQEYMRHKMMRMIAPQAIRDAQDALQKEFDNKKDEQAYTHDIITMIRKELS